MQTPPWRPLRLTSPHARGEDVRRLQVALCQRRRARGKPVIDVDGVYGPETAAAVRDAARYLGAAEPTIRKGATIGVQRIIRDPGSRSPVQLARAKARRMRAANRPEIGTGGDAAVRWAASKIGVREQPANSNTGPQIQDWQKRAGMGAGPWCGAFAKAAADAAGADVTPEARYCPWIERHAKAKTGGYEGWCAITDSLARPGDHVLFDWSRDGVADHVGVLERVNRDDGTVTCIEGNTSSTGSQDNGGAVLRKTRPFRQVRGVARVRW